MVVRVISGGQTGVDQAALRAAASLGISIGGWCPPGRVCEDGIIPAIFPLTETPQGLSAAAPAIPRSQRTEWNVRDSDGTLLLSPRQLNGGDPGLRWTAECAACYRKTLIVADPCDLTAVPRIRQWIEELRILTLNIAGPSEGSCPGIGALAEKFVAALLAPRS